MRWVSFGKIGLLLLLGIAGCFAQAQTQRIDSLKHVIAGMPANRQKIDVLLALCAERNSLHPDTVAIYAASARELAIREHEPLKALLAEYYIAFNLLTKGLHDSSLRIADRQLKTLDYTGEGKEVYVDFLLLKARALNNDSKAKESLGILYRLLSEAEKHEDTATQIAAINGMVGGYVMVGDDRKALQWGYKALHLFPHVNTLDIARMTGVTLSNISLCYLHLYETDSVKAYLDSAALYTRAAIAQDRKYGFQSAYDLGLQGTIYGFAGEVQKGEAALRESLQMYKTIGNAYYILNAMSVLGDFYYTIKQPDKGIAICKEGIALQGNMKPNLYLYGNLAENYKLKGMYREYAETLDRLGVIKDSLYKVNSAQALSDLQAKYEVQAKENTIIRQKLDLAKKNNLLYGSLALLVFVLVFGFVLLAVRKKNQAIRLQQWQVAEKRKTLQAVLQAEENERVRIAADLHDGAAQKMVVARMNLQTFGTYFPGLDAEQQRVFDNISALVEESCTEVRDLSHSMMPQAFFKSGLTEAVKNLLNRIGDRRLLVKFNAEGSLEGVPENMQIMIYRIMQECIQNVLKHARAKTLDISIIAEKEELAITVEDDGIGFDAGSVAGGGVGLTNMRSRVAFLNGQLEISSRPGAGTLMAFYIPLNKTA